MLEMSQQHVDRLEAIAASLRVLVGELKAAEVVTPPDLLPDVMAKEESRTCLICGDVKPKRYVRGQCGRCNQNVRNAIERGHITEAQLIQIGKMTAQPKAGGRVASNPLPVDDLLRQWAARNDVGAEVIGAINNAAKLLEEERDAAVQNTEHAKGGHATNNSH